MTNDEHPRDKDAGLGKARERDIARRGLVGLHKTATYSEAGATVNEQASELKPFEHELRAILLTNENSIQVAKMNPTFQRVCDTIVPDIILPPLPAPPNPNLPFLPPGRSWFIYRVPNFMESGEVIRLTIKATYNDGAVMAGMQFLLARRNPTNPRFTPDDIIYQNPALAINPPQTGIVGIGNWATWYDQNTALPFVYPFSEIRGQAVPGGAIVDRATDFSLYIICESWSLAPPPAGQLKQMLVRLITEDRGR